jgi:hypothetical protein
MALVEKRPLTPAQRFHVVQQRDLARKRPERRLSKSLSKSGGRNCYGRITMRRRGGGHKRLYRKIDFRRDKFDIPARVSEIEYDPNRSADIALLVYADGDKRYIISPEALKKGDRVITTRTAGELRPGNNMPLRFLAPSTRVHAVELQPGKGAQIARSAGVGAQMVIVDGDRVTLNAERGTAVGPCRLPGHDWGSGERLTPEHHARKGGAATLDGSPAPGTGRGHEPGRPPHGRRGSQDFGRRASHVALGTTRKGLSHSLPFETIEQDDSGSTQRAQNAPLSDKGTYYESQVSSIERHNHGTLSQEGIFRGSQPDDKGTEGSGSELSQAYQDVVPPLDHNARVYRAEYGNSQRQDVFPSVHNGKHGRTQTR